MELRHLVQRAFNWLVYCIGPGRRLLDRIRCITNLLCKRDLRRRSEFRCGHVF